ncbi:aminotransferase class I/II-fold pyridoxal phosphate-dependent enzyme [Aliivibrio fischeri]|uniref:Aminotransferase class I/II-fold pyridoxal phosphate-dependent enzyme n=1 Tax=Aliivibrio fischeri TaxID=668 RepID=A0A6N3YZX2_ALIFS|nr:PLP-dependent aminotransferase family protein [Aliivibrio fischeri]MUK44971.1 aminotransferase class I/II-fold pyridoxal phosphate-dependent enzyme [Aliivibrio fischeri]MUK80630.1 aminotransferase class I/II-fold pyridoxal phosphate-dependent enzyme [Aliivibrio fischeri]MUK84361.1 aminotransferase class I/II-fold pyridoxal phosphate-dependent enzyme [Aliivibrio fischeri]MUL15675.1 aminotransferase class I/II-fold pyridoxal phosphate-dependent enzyme [Aliivibrio fischeri]
MEIAHSLQQIQSSYIREILAAASDKNVISLAGGLPDEETFPIEIMKPILESLSDMPDVFQYGATAGYAPLLEFLTQKFELPENHLPMICTGSQQGLDLIARAYINPGDTVVMEAPSYLGAMQVFGLVQASISTVSQTEFGPNLEELEQCFIQESPKMFYAVPDFHNPTGVCWSLETRKKVAELCIQYNVAFIEDAPYRELRFTGEALPMVSTFCPQNSIVLRSFSKIASPGLRIGVVTGKKSYIEPLIKVKQGADLHSSVPMQALLLGLLKHEKFEQHMQTIQTVYKQRYDVLYNELKAQLPAQCEVNAVDGGMFIWVSLPDCDTFELARTLIANGVAVVPSPVFYPKPEGSPAALRLNFTNAKPNELVEAVNRLTNVLNKSVN